MKHLQKFNENLLHVLISPKCLEEIESISYILEDEGFQISYNKNLERDKIRILDIILKTSEYWTNKIFRDSDGKIITANQLKGEAASNAISWVKEAYEEYLDRLIEIVEENGYEHSINIWICNPKNYHYLSDGYKLQILRFSKGKYSKSKSHVAFQKNFLENE